MDEYRIHAILDVSGYGTQAGGQRYMGGAPRRKSGMDFGSMLASAQNRVQGTGSEAKAQRMYYGVTVQSRSMHSAVRMRASG